MTYECSPSKNLTKRAWLDYLYYKEGGQRDFYLCGTYGEPKERKFTKWKTYRECIFPLDEFNGDERWEDRKFFEQINQRQILPHEIVLDIEEPEQLVPIADRIEEWGWRYYIFETGSRGFHISLFGDRDMTALEKEAIVGFLGADIQKCSKKNMIALEYCPHWKTGEIKQEVEA